MKKITALALTAICLALPLRLEATKVKGYTRKNGTYVQPHHRTAPDASKRNNYSTRGNVNPYNGRRGTVDPTKPKKH